MKNLKFYVIAGAFLIGFVCIGIAWYREHTQLKALQASGQKIKEQILTGAKEISRVVKANGTENLMLDITGNHTSAENANRTDIPDIVDTAAMALDIRTRQLKEITVIAAQYKAENVQLKAQIDSNRHIYYTYSGKGLDLKFTPPYDSTGYATADFLGTFGITVVQGYKKKWFLGEEKTLMSITSNSPYFRVSNVNYVGFDKKALNLNIEAQATASFNTMTGAGVGAGIKLEVGRFDLYGNYQYYQQQKNWMYGGTATFRLAKF